MPVVSHGSVRKKHWLLKWLWQQFKFSWLKMKHRIGIANPETIKKEDVVPAVYRDLCIIDLKMVGKTEKQRVARFMFVYNAFYAEITSVSNDLI
jgi:hypothetical protein